MIDINFSLAVTILYLIALYIFMNRLFFSPVSKILHKRRELIEGRLESAQKRIADVDQKTAEYDQAMRTARTEMYRSQESRRESALSERAELIAKAKVEAEKLLKEAR